MEEHIAPCFDNIGVVFDGEILDQYPSATMRVHTGQTELDEYLFIFSYFIISGLMCALSTFEHIICLFLSIVHWAIDYILLTDSFHHKTDFCRFPFIFYVVYAFYFILVKIHVNRCPSRSGFDDFFYSDPELETWQSILCLQYFCTWLMICFSILFQHLILYSNASQLYVDVQFFLSTQCILYIII